MSLLCTFNPFNDDDNNDSTDSNVESFSPGPNILSMNNVLHTKESVLEAVELLNKLGNTLKKIVLKSRYVHFADDVDNMCTTLLKAILQHSPSLEHLHLQGIPLQNKVFIELLHKSHLKTLVLDSNGLDSDILSNLDVYLKAGLEELRIEKNTVDRKSVV